MRKPERPEGARENEGEEKEIEKKNVTAAAEGQKVSVIKSIPGFDISLKLYKVGAAGGCIREN